MTPKDARIESLIFEDLQELCSSSGYIHAIAYFCWRDNLIRFSGDRVTEGDVQHQYSHEKLLRSEISTLIGLLAKRNIDTRIPKPSTIQNYLDQSEALLYEMHISLQKPWTAAFEAMTIRSSKANRVDPFGTAEGLREPIFYSGESAYNFQYEELALLKYGADEDWLNSRFGFSISEAVTVVRKIGELQINKISNLRKEMMHMHPNQLTCLSGFTFKICELEAATRLPFEKIESVVKAFTVDLSKENTTFSSLSAFNEINAAPIIKLDADLYILLQHYSLLEALYEAPFFWMIGDKAYSATASKNRGAFAEQFLSDRLIHVFGLNNVFKNVNIYKGNNRITEVDVLVVYGDRAIVVQAKSKRLTIEARKGNDLQLKEDFRKAIRDSYDQALLCSEALLSRECRLVSSSAAEISFLKRPTKIFPVCTVSDHFPALAAQSRQFLKIKTTDNLYPPIITDIFFVDTLTEILDTPLQLLNYLTLRAKFDRKLLVSQEITNLGYHLKHNLWLEDKYDMVNLGDEFTSSLDIAMCARRLNVPGERTPKGILTRFDGTTIGRLISEFEANGHPELVSLGLILLQFSSDTAKHINAGVDRLVRSAADDGQAHDISVPSIADKSGLTIHVNSMPNEEAQERLLAHCQIRKYDTKSDVWYGLILGPADGRVRGVLSVEEKWKPDANMERVLAVWPRKPMISVKKLSQVAFRNKVGRNEMCPCGSGNKFKKCCLNRS